MSEDLGCKPDPGLRAPEGLDWRSLRIQELLKGKILKGKMKYGNVRFVVFWGWVVSSNTVPLSYILALFASGDAGF